MKSNNILLVEGVDDLHVISALLQARETAETFTIEQKRGVDNLFAILPVQIKSSSISAIGVVIDADVDIGARWDSFKGVVDRAGYQTVPSLPNANGTIVSENGLPKIGIWLMPDNVLTGMLEDFVCKLVPEGDSGYFHASSVLKDLPANVRRFSDRHIAKARIHTWLSWQKDPGTPMGLALTKKYLDPSAPTATPFVKWLENLFVLQA